MPAKPSIVFAHGLWADGSCFSKVIPTLQAEGHQVIASQHALDSVESDVATVIRTIGRVSGPVLLVGHSYGGTLITAAGTDDRSPGWSTSPRWPPTKPRPPRAIRLSSPPPMSSTTSRSRMGASG